MSESESNTNPNQEIKNDQTPTISLYEKSRQERIKSNLERMQKLGLFDLSLKLKSSSAPKRTYKNNPSPAKHPSPLHSSGPLRRSSRLQNTTPVTYSEVVLSKKNEEEDFRREVGSKPEVYTEEHLKLLGSTERSWEFFVDGYGKDGKRIYDPINGKTCHQCRQKTLGYRTHCCRCNVVQGQFCGDCLYMRYGEHVLEAIENPNWICPPCRGICNCSLCRQAKGWAPTGPLYRKISSMGYKSVAHYLIETQRSQNTVEKDSETANQVSAKRSLPFPEEEKPSTISNKVEAIGTQRKRSLLFPAGGECSEDMESVEVKSEAHGHPGLTESKFEEKTESGLKCEKENHVSNDGTLATDGQTKILITAEAVGTQTKRPLLFPAGGECSEDMESVEVKPEAHGHPGLTESKFEEKTESGLKCEKENHVSDDGTLAADGQTKRSLLFPAGGECSKDMESVEVKSEAHGHPGLTESKFEEKTESGLKCEKENHVSDDGTLATDGQTKILIIADGEAASVKMEPENANGHLNSELTPSINEKILDVTQSVINSPISVINSPFANREMNKEEELQAGDGKNADSIAKVESCPKLKKKTAPNPDSIGARLRQRRRMETQLQNV